MLQNNEIFEIGLNIHLLSFTLPKNLIKDKDDVRVSITTIPDGTKQHFSLQGKKMNCTNHVFSLNITNQTKHIILVFRRKTFLSENPIIGSVTIHTKDFPIIPQSISQLCAGSVTADVKSVNIYYPLQKQMKEMESQTCQNMSKDEMRKQMKRKILGQMQIQLSFTSPYYSSVKSDNKNEKNNSKIEMNKIHKSKKGKKGDYEKLANDSNYENNSLL